VNAASAPSHPEIAHYHQQLPCREPREAHSTIGIRNTLSFAVAVPPRRNSPLQTSFPRSSLFLSSIGAFLVIIERRVFQTRF
jgi:hypothetical protein